MVHTNPGIIKRGCEGLQTKAPVSDSSFWLIVLMKFPKMLQTEMHKFLVMDQLKFHFVEETKIIDMYLL